MSEMELGGRTEELNYKITVSSESIPESLHQSHLITALVAELVLRADTRFWEEKGSNEVTPDEFYTAMLGAVARHYAYSYLDHLEEPIPASEILEELIAGQKDEGHLKELLPIWEESE